MPGILVEGESDAHALWFHGFDAVAAPGAGVYSPQRDDDALEGLTVYAVVEDDQGGETLIRQLLKSKHAKRIKLVKLPNNFKDVCEVHQKARDQFHSIIRDALANAKPLVSDDVNDAPTNVVNDSSTGRQSLADVLVQIAIKGAKFFITPDGIEYAAVEVDKHREVWPLKSRAFKSWLVHRYYSTNSRAPSPDVLAQALLTLEAVATFQGDKQPVYIRTAAHDGRLYVDLCDDAWRVVEIDTQGWRILDRSPVLFRRSQGALPLPEPVVGGDVNELKTLLNVASDDDFKLIVAWLVAALRPRGPYPLLALAGEPGTSKTSTATVLRSLVDPHVAGIRRPPREERDLFINASKTAALVYDNLSSIPEWLSDGLCVVATGGTFSARSMRTNDEETLLTVERPVMITSVGEVIARSDLADRAMLVTLAVIPEGERKSKEAFENDLERARPRLFGVLLTALSRGLRELSNTKIDNLPRMADFITWATACEGAFGFSKGDVYKAFTANMKDAVEGVLEGDAVSVALRKWFDKRNGEPWQGKTEALLSELNTWAEIEARKERSWPKNPQALRSRLTMAAPSLRKIGIAIERKRADGKRWLEVYMS